MTRHDLEGFLGLWAEDGGFFDFLICDRARQMLRNSPTALRLIKSAMNATEDGQAGLQQLAGDATMLFYQSEEGNEGRQAYLEKRPPDFSRFPRRP